jgi:hypothetical protein
MAYLRIVLIVLSILAAIALFGMMKHSFIYRADEIVMMWLVLAGISLNFVYLALVTPDKSIGLFGRFPRMFRLWLDAKEADLQQRTTRSVD